MADWYFKTENKKSIRQNSLGMESESRNSINYTQYVWMDGWMYGCMDVWMYGCMDVWMYACMDVWMYACMHAWMDGWMHGWMYVCMIVLQCIVL